MSFEGEIGIREGDLHSAKRIDDCLTGIEKLDFFDDVRIVPVDSEQTDER